MPSSNLAAYLAKNYLTASTPSASHPGEPPKKKRKKSKHQAASTGLIIADDDEDLSLATMRAPDDEDGDTPMMYEGQYRSAEFRKAKKNAWQPLSTAQNDGLDTEGRGDGDDADALIRTAQSDEARRLAARDAEDAPAIVEMDAPRMESGMRAGLQTAADTARIHAEEQVREEAERRSKKSKKKTEEPQEETIYRDATGRRIDVSLRKAEVRREQAEKAAAEKKERIDAMGDVQRREREEKKQELEDAKFLSLGRGVEDLEYNERLKGEVRWDDPMAAYMAEKRREEGGGEEVDVGRGEEEVGKGRTKGRREYTGAAPPNRYGIKPGWRWDGVDRGNGFEKEWFQARSNKSRNQALSYEWQMDE